MRVADFFCGGGGFSEGFRQAGFDIVFAVDKWEPAITTYKGNKPGVNVILDDVIRISELSDDEFELLIPDSEVIIGSPPCQAFSQSNKSGNADKTLGIKLIEAFLRIVARKKFKKGSVLKYWVLENVPNSQKYIKEKYTAEELGLDGDFVLETRCEAAGVYNAMYFGAPTNRRRFLCGDFPEPAITHENESVVELRRVLDSFGDPLSDYPESVVDINYPDLVLPKCEITDLKYIHELAPFEWKTAERLKRDKGYMGKMSFPENLEKPARTVLATMSASSREAMILSAGRGKYRLPTVREAASMMSFPLDYWFYGKTKGIKHTLVGNAVPPKLSYAIAKAIADELNVETPSSYIRIKHDETLDFYNLNGESIPVNHERRRRETAKFKYHVPYLIERAFRVELTNYHSDFQNKDFYWDAEIHYSQGKKRARVYTPIVNATLFNKKEADKANAFIKVYCDKHLLTEQKFQEAYCLTQEERTHAGLYGPFELLNVVRNEIDECKSIGLLKESDNCTIETTIVPKTIVYGYYILSEILRTMRKEDNNANH